MEALELKKLLVDRPRKPFRLHMSDGTKIDVLHPDFAKLTWTQIHVNTPERNSEIVIDSKYVPLMDVTSAEFIEKRGKVKSKKSNGKK